MKRSIAIAVLIYCYLAAVALCAAVAALAVQALAASAPEAPADRAQVLVVWQGYDGPVETAGDVLAWRYAGSLMRIEYGDRNADGIRRNGFEMPVPPPCLGTPR